MRELSVTSKGQVTIPKDVRQALGITTGTRVKIMTEGASARLTVARKLKPSRVEDGPKICGYHGPTLTLDDMERAIARGMAGERPPRRRRK